MTLTEIGFAKAAIEHAKSMMFDKVLDQVANRARLVKNGPFTGSWNNSYSFSAVSPWIGGATIKGRFGGTVKKDGKTLIIEAEAEYEFSDMFTDLTNKRQGKIGRSALQDIPYDPSKPWWNSKNLTAGLLWLDSDYGGTPYPITSNWKTEITGSISSE